MHTYEALNKAAQPLFDLLVSQVESRMAGNTYEYFYVLKKGRKYHAIIRQEREKSTGKVILGASYAGFVDGEGNVYKSSQRRPAKGIRGNLFEDLNSITDNGGYIRYLR